MTPKEKAIDLVDKYRILLQDTDTEVGNEILCTLVAKSCALICCNEVLGYMGADRGYAFWTSVKQEIEKL